MARDTDYIEVKVVHLCRDGKHSLTAMRHIPLQEYDSGTDPEFLLGWAVHCMREQIHKEIRLRRFNSFDPSI